MSNRAVKRRGFLYVISGAGLALGMNLAAPSIAVTSGEGQSVRRPKDPNSKPLFESHEPSILGERVVRYNPNRDFGDLITKVGDDVFNRLAAMEPNSPTDRFVSLKDEYPIPDTDLITETYLVKRVAQGDFQVLVSVHRPKPPFGSVLTLPFNLATATQIKEITALWNRDRMTGFEISDHNEEVIQIPIMVKTYWSSFI